jgi:hypothetical protein
MASIGSCTPRVISGLDGSTTIINKDCSSTTQRLNGSISTYDPKTNKTTTTSANGKTTFTFPGQFPGQANPGFPIANFPTVPSVPLNLQQLGLDVTH